MSSFRMSSSVPMHDPYHYVEQIFSNLHPIKPEVRTHLMNVYSLLGSGILVAIFGIVFDLWYQFNGLISVIVFFIFIIMIKMDRNKDFSLRRALLFYVASFYAGIHVGPLIGFAISVNPDLIVLAAFLTAFLFGMMTLTVYFLPSRNLVAFAGFLSYAITILFCMNLFTLFFPTDFNILVLLYGGLLVFCCYVIYDTQIIIEQATKSPDVVGHALDLLIDSIAIFVRVLNILLHAYKSKKPASSSASASSASSSSTLSQSASPLKTKIN